MAGFLNAGKIIAKAPMPVPNSGVVLIISQADCHINSLTDADGFDAPEDAWFLNLFIIKSDVSILARRNAVINIMRTFNDEDFSMCFQLIKKRKTKHDSKETNPPLLAV